MRDREHWSMFLAGFFTLLLDLIAALIILVFIEIIGIAMSAAIVTLLLFVAILGLIMMIPAIIDMIVGICQRSASLIAKYCSKRHDK